MPKRILPKKQPACKLSFEVIGDELRINLPSGHVAFADKADEDLVTSHRWYRAPTDHPHVWTKINGRKVMMHRMILNTKPGDVVQHLDGNGLNNRRSNLRICDGKDVAAAQRIERWERRMMAFTIAGDELHIALGRGRVAIADASDFDLLKNYRWHYLKPANSATGYAFSASHGKRIYMHRLITSAPKGMDVDHRDQNGLNNRRGNLRNCSHSQNQANRRWCKRKSPNGVCSKYRGVSSRQNGTFAAQLGYQNKTLWLGTFATEEDAAKAYDRKAIELFGEFACPNFPKLDCELYGNQTVA